MKPFTFLPPASARFAGLLLAGGGQHRVQRLAMGRQNLMGRQNFFVSPFSQATITKSKKPSDHHARQANGSPQRWMILTRKSLAGFAAN
jgi:hypothetical protein